MPVDAAFINATGKRWIHVNSCKFHVDKWVGRLVQNPAPFFKTKREETAPNGTPVH